MTDQTRYFDPEFFKYLSLERFFKKMEEEIHGKFMNQEVDKQTKQETGR